MSEPARVALVTGANRGLGLAIAAGLADHGYTTLLCGRDPRRAEAAARSLGRRAGAVVPLQLDVTDQRSVDAAAAAVERRFGRIDALVNNAAIAYDDGQRPGSAGLAIVRDALETNLIGAWRVCEAFLPLMQRRRYGRIVNVSSSAGAFAEADGGTPAYAVSKAALNMLTLSLAKELAGSGILVNAVCPGWVRTDMGGPNAPLSPEQGADTPVWLATLPDDGPTGGFFRERRPIPW